MRDDLSDLIARIEAAREGSEELDVALQRRLCGYAEDSPLWHCPPYTRSLDSALTLVPPEGWTFGVSTFAPNEVFNPGGAQAYVMRADALGKSDAGGYHHAEAATPALALVAAALRARSMT